MRRFPFPGSRLVCLLAVACAVLLASTSAALCASSSTTLLFTFATSQAGFDSSLIIANPTALPSGGTPINGACTLTYFGINAPSPQSTGTISGGTIYAKILSTDAPGFLGYVIATCAFPGASGETFVSDLGARNLAAGYEARVLPTPEDSAAADETQDIEDALFQKRPIASFYLPAAQGGKLEQIDLLVQSTIARVTASGESTNGAAAVVGYAHLSQSLGKFKDAYLQYCTAYCKAVSPISKLAQCN
jgi:hypothetical protein